MAIPIPTAEAASAVRQAETKDQSQNRDKPEVEQREPEVDPKVVAAAVEGSNSVTFEGRLIEFSFNKDINRVVVKVTTEDGEEIIRQIPPEEYITFAARFRELMGVLLDETA